MKYPQIMLEITNNMLQNQNLIEKSQLSTTSINDNQDGILIIKKVDFNA